MLYFIQLMRFSWQVYWGGLPFPPPVDGKNGRTVQKDLNELDNYDGVGSHPESDILEYEI